MAVLLWQHNPQTQVSPSSFSKNFSTEQFWVCPKKKALDCLMTLIERSCQQFPLHDAWAIAVHWWGLCYGWKFWMRLSGDPRVGIILANSYLQLSGDIQTFVVSGWSYVSHHAIKTCLCLIWKTPTSYNSEAPVYNTESVVSHKLLKPAHKWSF